MCPFRWITLHYKHSISCPFEHFKLSQVAQLKDLRTFQQIAQIFGEREEVYTRAFFFFLWEMGFALNTILHSASIQQMRCSIVLISND